jgi:hypothetical protein
MHKGLRGEQDPGRAVSTGGQHDSRGAQFTRRGRDTDLKEGVLGGTLSVSPTPSGTTTLAVSVTLLGTTDAGTGPRVDTSTSTSPSDNNKKGGRP